jgi:hypothetical protein
MKNKNSLRLTAALLSVMIYSFRIIYGQTIQKNIPFDKLHEKVALSTDKEIYCTGEPLFFKAFNLSDERLRSADWSKVLYVEMITPDGKPVLHGKFEYDSNGASGGLMIPEDILTGNYYLRAYTKWMRNFSPYSYYYKIIKIINPFSGELLKPQSESVIYQEDHSSDTLKSGDFSIKTDKQVYQPREKIILTASSNTDILTASSNTDFSQNRYFSISVIRKGIERKFTCRIPDIKNTQSHPDYIPETRSVSISGKVLNQKDLSPVPYMHVCLSILNEAKNTFTTITEKSGCFYFSLPEKKGEVEIFISLKNVNPEIEPVILVDNDFCSKEVNLPFVPFAESESDKNLFNDLIFNSQITSKFNIVPAQEKSDETIETIPFYGSSVQSIRFNTYIPLPTIEDYLNEFLPNIVIRKKDKTKYFQILGGYSELSIYEPLVLVDYVAVYNVDWILSISPKKVNRIEVIEKPYILGDICYGGLIHIISSDGDFAGVNLPSSGQFFKYMMYTPPDLLHLKKPENPRIPDARNLLYWNPEVELKGRQSNEYVIFAGDEPGEYTAIIRGVDKLGKEIQNWCKFTVE